MLVTTESGGRAEEIVDLKYPVFAPENHSTSQLHVLDVEELQNEKPTPATPASHPKHTSQSSKDEVDGLSIIIEGCSLS